MPAAPSRRFPTTAWSCVQAAQDPNHPQFQIAMDRLITTYWKPVFHYLRAAGHPAEEAEDLTQEFFTIFWIKSWVRPADKARGRFRDLLVTMVKRFAHDRTVRARKQAKFEKRFVSVHGMMTDEDRAWEPPERVSPEEAFHRQWRAETLAAVRRNLREHYEGQNDPKELRRFEIFAAYHFAKSKAEQPTHQELMARFEVSADEVKTAFRNVKARYERLLRQEFRDQVSSEAEIDDEIRGLL